MTISPMQLDYVTKEEFGEFKDDNTDQHAELKDFMEDGFEKMDELITNSFIEFGGKMDIKFLNNNRLLISKFNTKLSEAKSEIIAAINGNE